MKSTLLMTYILLSCAVVNTSEAQAAPKVKLQYAESESLGQLRNKANQQAREVEKLSKEVTNVEVTLALNNKKYLQLAEQRHVIEERLTASRKTTQAEAETLDAKYNQTKKVLMGVLLNKLENAENSADMLARQILVKKLKGDLIELEGLIAQNKRFQTELEALQSSLEESMAVEKDLLNVMSELENKKIALKETLESKSKENNELQEELKNKRNQKKLVEKNQTMAEVREKLKPMQLTEKVEKNSPITASLTGGFISPLAQYAGLEYQSKGVTYNFKGKKSIRASKTGKIVYTGELANYGNVLMIEHGDDTRSVLLGQFDYNVKKGDSVQAGQVVGSTKESQNSGISDGKLYFEVRKNNLAQNTYLLLDKNTLARQ